MLGLAILTLVALTSLATYLLTRRRQRHPLASSLEGALAEGLPAGRGSHLERPPRVRTVAETDDGLIPVVRIDLEMADRPSETLAVEFTATVLEAIQPTLTAAADPIVAYEVEFTFGPDGLVVDGECGRVTVPATLADRLCTEERYRAFHLERDLDRLSDDAGSAAVLLGPCRTLP